MAIPDNLRSLSELRSGYRRTLPLAFHAPGKLLSSAAAPPDLPALRVARAS
jgi:hypothetical protein